MAQPHDEFAVLAREELAHALTLPWRDLERVVPWGDSFRGFAPSGAEVEIERSYIWAGEGDDILVEVEVRCLPDREDCGARVGGVIRRT